MGSGIDALDYGTIPTGRCSSCNEEDGVTIFVRRMYSVCLDRTPDEEGLNYWCSLLWNQSRSGSEVARGFVFSKEFQGKNLSDEEYVEYLYKIFFDRASDEEGKQYWMGKIRSGYSRQEVFDGFTGICQSL